MDTVGDGVGDKGVVSVTKDHRDRMKDKGGRGRVEKDVQGGGSMEVVYNVARGAVKLELVDSKGHAIGSWKAEGKVG